MSCPAPPTGMMNDDDDDDDDDDSDDDNDDDFQPPHLHGVPQQLPLDPRSHRRWLQFLNC